MFNKDTVLLQSYQCILVDFSCKAYSKVDFGCTKISDTIFLGLLYLMIIKRTPVLTGTMFMFSCPCINRHDVCFCVYFFTLSNQNSKTLCLNKYIDFGCFSIVMVKSDNTAALPCNHYC